MSLFVFYLRIFRLNKTLILMLIKSTLNPNLSYSFFQAEAYLTRPTSYLMHLIKKAGFSSCPWCYSHSIVAGGLDDTSYTTRETSLISFMIRVEILSTNSYGKCAKRAVIKSTVSTARSAITHA